MAERNVHDLLLRHAVYLSGLKRNAGDTFAGIATVLDADVKRIFARVDVRNLGELTKRQFDALIASLRKQMVASYDKHLTRFALASTKFVAVDISQHRRIFQAATGGRIGRAPAASAVWGRAAGSVNAATGMNYAQAARAVKASSLSLIERTVRTGYAQRMATVDVARLITGAGVRNVYAGGVLRRIVNWNSSFAATTWAYADAYTNHEVARTYFDQYQWVSVMDQTTTETCEDLNLQTFAYGDGPIPPAHYGCRSQILPFTDDAPPTSFADWLDSQPAEFLDDAFKKGNRELDNVKVITLDMFGEKIEYILI